MCVLQKSKICKDRLYKSSLSRDFYKIHDLRTTCSVASGCRHFQLIGHRIFHFMARMVRSALELEKSLQKGRKQQLSEITDVVLS